MTTLFRSDSPWSFIALLAAESAKLVIITSMVAVLLRSSIWRRNLWHACAAGLVLLITLEISGVGRSVAGWIYGDTSSWTPRNLIESSDEVPGTLYSSSAGITTGGPGAISSSPQYSRSPVSTSLLWIWLVGSIIAAIRYLLPRLLTARFLSRCHYVKNRYLIETMEELRGKMNIHRPVLILSSHRISSPMTLGINRPVIVVPADLESRFNLWQQRVILAHELAHVRSRDAQWHLIHDLINILLWWHPLMWYARAQTHSNSEKAADSAAISSPGSSLHLADSLLQLARQNKATHKSHSHSLSPQGIHITGTGFRSLLAQRIQLLLGSHSTQESEPNSLIAFAFKSFTALALASAGILCLA